MGDLHRELIVIC